MLSERLLLFCNKLAPIHAKARAEMKWTRATATCAMGIRGFCQSPPNRVLINRLTTTRSDVNTFRNTPTLEYEAVQVPSWIWVNALALIYLVHALKQNSMQYCSATAPTFSAKNCRERSGTSLSVSSRVAA